MKKLSIFLILGALLIALAGCGRSDEAENTNPNEDQTSVEASSSEKEAASGEKTWPEEFSEWDVPTIDNATITFADNKSATSTGLTQGINAIVNLKQLSKSDFDKYLAALEKKGFEKNADESLEDYMLIYEKSVTGGIIKMTIMYAEDTTTISVSNSAAAAEKEASAGGSADWPESVNGIPEFTKGSYIETVEMGGGMYAINFIDVTEEDLDWYRSTLESAGFAKQDSQDTEGYAKFDAEKAYSVGFALENGKLQIIVLSGSY